MKSYDIAMQQNFYDILDEVSQVFEQGAFLLLQEPAKDLVTKGDDATEEIMLYLLVFYICVEEKRGTHTIEQYIEIVKKSGEYKEIVPLLERFSTVFKNVELYEVILPICKKVATEMYRLGDENFRSVFEMTDVYANEIRSLQPQRSDIELVARSKQEYYLNLFGAQILNHLYTPAFRKTTHKYIFLPGCMAAAGEHCNATSSSLGAICADCTPDCLIHQIKQRVENLNASVRIFYHGSQIHALDENRKENYGLIGIACLPNLLEGGLKAKRLGFIPQCVFLDYGGCRQHWNPQGIPTCCDINRIELTLLNSI